MTGDLVSAQEADRLGLVNHVVPAESLMDEAMAMAHRLASGPAVAIRFNKRLVNKELRDETSHHGETRIAPLLAISSYAGTTIIRNPTPAIARPPANFAGLEILIFRAANHVHNHANTGAKMTINAEFTV